MEDSIRRLGENLLKEGEHAKFRNERQKFHDFVEMIVTRFPNALSEDRTLKEPFKSLALLVVVGQRPITSLMILETMLESGVIPLNGKELGKKLAEKLNISSDLTTKGGNYKDRVGDVISTLVKIGIVESVFSKSGQPRGEGFRIKKSQMTELKAFVDCISLESGILQSLKPLKIKELFRTRFGEKLEYVVKSGTKKRIQFSIDKIMKSLLDPKLGISFNQAIQIIEDVEPELRTGMRTLDIQSELYKTIKKYDEKAAENYRHSYPEILSITMSNGKKRTVNYKLVKNLIGKEVRLKLTSSLLDQFASTVYNVITRNPENYQRESAIREYTDALIRSECVPIRSDADFIMDRLITARSALEGCHNSLQSDEVKPAKGLFEQFIEQICLVTLVEFGYLPFKNSSRNVDLISNLLKQTEVKKDLKNELRLEEDDLFHFQRIRFLMQMKDAPNRKSFEKLVDEGEKLIALCEDLLKIISTRPLIKQYPDVDETSESAPPTHVSTGYKDLDNLMLGGIPENYAVLLTSPSCDERDLLIERFLKTGMNEKETVFHITIDARGVETLAQEYPKFHIFICNPEADVIVKSLPNVFKLKGVENLTEIDIALTSALRRLERSPKDTRRACIEIVSDVLLQHHAVSTRRWLTALIPKLESRGFTTLAIVNPHMHSSQEVEAILDLFDGEIQLYRRKTEKGFRRYLRIEKLYNQNYVEDELSLRKDRLLK